MIVDLPEPDGPTSAVTVPGGDAEGDAVEHLLPLVVRELDVLEDARRP